MIESFLINYLKSQGFDAALERQKGIDIILDKTGGQLNGHQFLHTFAIQTYGSSKAKAADLSYKVMQAMLDMPDKTTRVVDVLLNAGPYDFTDTSTKEYRYQAVYEIYEY